MNDTGFDLSNWSDPGYVDASSSVWVSGQDLPGGADIDHGFWQNKINEFQSAYAGLSATKNLLDALHPNATDDATRYAEWTDASTQVDGALSSAAIWVNIINAGAALGLNDRFRDYQASGLGFIPFPALAVAGGIGALVLIIGSLTAAASIGWHWINKYYADNEQVRQLQIAHPEFDPGAGTVSRQIGNVVQQVAVIGILAWAVTKYLAAKGR